MFGGTLLHADLADAVVFTGGFDDKRPFVDGAGERLFDVDVAAGVEGVDRDVLMPVVGRGNEDGIEVFGVEQAAVVGEGRGFGRVLFGTVEFGAIHVAEGLDADGLVALELSHVAAAAIAEPDDAEVHGIVRAEHAGIRGGSKRQGGRRGSAGYTAEEGAPAGGGSWKRKFDRRLRIARHT